MRSITITAGLLLTAAAAPLAAQGAAGPEAPKQARCYIEVRKLMAPAGGIPELGAAIRQLDEKLRPQVAEITLLKREMSALEGRPAGGIQQVNAEESFENALAEVAPAPEGSDARLTRVVTDLAAKQAKLKTDYAEQMRAIMGPVQVRLGESAQAYSRERGCSELKMARAPDLAALQTGGAQDLTGDFVTWYTANKS